jgi:BirA family transcriptional regulator, biotin operon repressor / biotin---[acetyl-CoA-carboxylase] ligase
MDQETPLIFKFDNLASTNLKMKELEQERNLPEFSVVVTPDQTAGKGQPGNSWESEAGKNLTFSFLIRPFFLTVHEQFRITQLVTLAIMDTLHPLVDGLSIKWPNDIYAGNRKLAGILIENTLTGVHISSSVIGIGININQEVFKSNAPNPVSLKILTKQEILPEAVLNSFLNTFLQRYVSWVEVIDDKQLEREYMSWLFRANGIHRFRDKKGEFRAQIHQIKPSGHLVLKTDESEFRTYAFKEVSFVL